MLALYHFGPVANSLTPLLCLIEKGLEFEDRFLNSRTWDHHAPEVLALNPEGMVPILVHDGQVVTESTVINEYLEDNFPESPLRPANLWQRAQMRVWTKYVDEHFCPALTVIGAHGATPFASKIDKGEMNERLARMPNPDVRRKWAIVSETGYSAEALDDARARVARAIRRMEDALAAGGPWILGDGYSLADIKLYSMAAGLERVMPGLCAPDLTPSLIAWLRRMEARPAVLAMRARRYVR